MTFRDIYLLSPELSVAGLGILIILLDLFIRRTSVMASVSLLGLLFPLVLTLTLYGELDANDTRQLSGTFGTFVVDGFGLFFKLLVMAVLALIIMSSGDFVRKLGRFGAEYYAILLFSTSGMMLLVSATELISIYIALELTALPIATLAAFGRDSRSSESGVKFLLLSAMSSAILLYGMVLVYGSVGSTQLTEIFQGIQSSIEPSIPFGGYGLFLGITMMTAGFGFKIASVPFQMWVPDVYEGAPTPVTAYLSVASKAAGFAIILRVFYVAFGDLSVDWAGLFAGLAVASMTVGNLVAVAQTNIKRMLAYSTIAHAGYIMVGIASVAASMPSGEVLVGPSGVLFYLVAYAASNLAAFFVIIVIASNTGSELIRDMVGFARQSPMLAGVLAFALISLTGLPPTVGFMGKMYLFSSALSSDLAWLAIMGVLNSVLSAYYYLRVIRVMYTDGNIENRDFHVAPMPMIAIAVTSIGILALGIFPEPLFTATQSAVQVLLR